MAKYPFLSDEWVVEARIIYAEAEAAGALSQAPPALAVRVNLIVTDVPFSAEPVRAHLDTGSGRVAIDTGHLEQPDVTVSLDYATARSLFVTGDAQALLQAFLSGRIKVDGDLTKLLDPRSGIWPGAPGPARLPGGLGAAFLGGSSPGSTGTSGTAEASRPEGASGTSEVPGAGWAGGEGRAGGAAGASAVPGAVEAAGEARAVARPGGPRAHLEPLAAFEPGREAGSSATPATSPGAEGPQSTGPGPR